MTTTNWESNEFYQDTSLASQFDVVLPRGAPPGALSTTFVQE